MNARVTDARELPGEPVRALSRRVYPALDGVRGIAVLLVMIHNLTIFEHRASIFEKVWVFATDAGWIGVQLFFVLSGFLITGILLDERGRPRYFRDFYLRRIVRIFPLYYLVLFVRFAILPRFWPDTAVPFELAIGFWLYVSNWTELAMPGVNGFGHFWSLAVEEQFYLAWPLAVARLGARGLAWVCAALIAISGIARVVIHVRGVDPHWLYLSTITRADALAFGALVAIALREPRWRALLVRTHRQVGGAAAVVLAAILAHAHGLSRFDTLVETVGYSILAILFAAGIARIALDDTRTRPRWATNRILRAAGTYSYAAYVFHPLIKVSILYYTRPWLVAHGALETLWMDVAFVATCIATSFAMARLSYAILEGPLLRRKERWAPRTARA
jgi:peptidoglycan/LPS O-acetylase OafA/YrhL